MGTNQKNTALLITGFCGSLIGTTIADLLFEEQGFVKDFLINALSIAVCYAILYLIFILIVKLKKN